MKDGKGSGGMHLWFVRFVGVVWSVVLGGNEESYKLSSRLMFLMNAKELLENGEVKFSSAWCPFLMDNVALMTPFGAILFVSCIAL
jgi:hypothetical protein